MAAIYIAVSTQQLPLQESAQTGPSPPLDSWIKCPELAHLVRVRGVKEILVKMEE